MTFTPRAWQNHSQGGTDTLDAAALIDLEQRVYDGAVADAVAQSGGGGGSNGYTNQDYEKTGTYVYVGYKHTDGRWYIYRRTIATGLRQYTNGASNYSTNWTGRAGLTYA